MITTKTNPLAAIVLFLVPGLFLPAMAVAQAGGNEGKAKSQVVVLECYYRSKWGYSDEFFRLYKKNHLPVMRKLQEEGRVLKIEVTKPRFHTTEEGRWDYRVTLTYRDAAAAHDPEHEEDIKRKLYPDQDLLHKEEARRFEVLAAHWDVIVDPVNPDTK